MDRFNFFFSFYGLILGLAATEVLAGFARFVRARAVRSIGPQTALLAIFTFIAICATWIDAWDSLRTAQLNFENLWAPILVATSYYLAATVIFPADPDAPEPLDSHFLSRKRFIVAMLLAAEMLIHWTFLPLFREAIDRQPAVFWLYTVPWNAMIEAAMITLLIVKGRRASIACLVALILLFLVPYWEKGAISRAVQQRYGALWATSH